jgi:tRNA1Val (adenine37-N6)-methyltransferase
MADGETVDQICRGAVTLAQPRTGYRFNIDSVLLADFARRVAPSPGGGLAVDLGAGCGVVGLLLARWWSGCRVVLVELQEELARLAEENVRRNGLGARVRVVQADLRRVESWRSGNPARVVVSNPPFFKQGRGRVSSNPQVALAKHEVACRLEEVVTAAGAVLEREGGLAMVHASDRAEEIERALRDAGLHLRVRRAVLPLPARPCNRVLLWATRTPGPVEERPPLTVESSPGRYADELRDMLGEP